MKPVLVPLLAEKAAHLPDYTWYEDLIQFHFNTNPVLGVILHHPFHPVTRLERVFILIGTLTFGLLGTLIVFEFFVDLEEMDEAKQKLIADGTAGAETGEIDVDEMTATVYKVAQMYLWTTSVGVLQSIFVGILWKLNACVCFKPGGNYYSSERPDRNRRCLYFGNAIAFVLVLSIISLLVLFMIMTCDPSAVDSITSDETTAWTDMFFSKDNDAECPFTEVSFWKLYAFQIGTATGVQFVVATVKFTGVVSYMFCDKALCMKFMGGRRAEMLALKKELEEEKQEAQDKA